jgi:hypothetical protein
MKDYHNDKYENFFLNLKISRPSLAKFADFTAEAIDAAGVDALIKGHREALMRVLTVFRQGMTERTGQSGGSQTGTRAEQEAFDLFKEFINETDVKALQPYFFDKAADEETFYPDQLAGLTQAPKKERLTRLTAYTQALEAAEPAAVKACGTRARVLLGEYEQARTAKTRARTALQDTIANLGPEAIAVAEALWDIDTAARYAHRREPMQARKYFDYAGLPTRKGGTKPKVAPKAA